MSIMCWLNGHSYESTECWEGDAYNCLKVGVYYYRCTRCGKVDRRVVVHGKLPRTAAESLCASDNIIASDYLDNEETSAAFELITRVAKPKRVRVKKETPSDGSE